YTLVIAFDTPALPSGVIKTNALPIQLTATDPGPGRGLVQFAAMAAYDTEDAISLSGGDPEGLLAAAKALASPPPVLEPDAEPNVLFDAVAAQEQGETKVEGIRRFVGVPISELAASPDGTRIAAGLKGWGNNLFVLDGQGRALGKDLAGKFFPVRLETFAGGFAVLSHENDPTTLYLKLNDREGKPMLRVAAPGRRVGGVRDCTPNFPEQADNFLKQASFSLTPDGRRLGAAGSKGIAVWDLKARKVVARDDSVHYNAPGPESHAWPDTASFPQVRLSPDGRRFVLQHNGKLFMRDAATGATLDQVSLPVGSTMGRVQLFDGHLLVVGDREFFAFRDGKLLWHWKAPDEVTASAFAPDGLRYAIGEVGGAVRLMNGGGQVGGFVPAGGGMITTLGLLPESGRVAFATATGGVGVVEFSGRVVWQGNVDARAVIRLAGPSGETVVGDGRGIVRRFGADGKKLWETALTPLVWRPDTHNLLLAPDPTPTLRLPAPKSPQTAVPAGAPNLAPQATVKYLPSRSWWKERIDPDRSVSLNDGKRDSPPGGWFDRTKLEYLAFVPSPPTWELTWKEPVAIGTVVVCESPDHPEAVPEEVKVEAWLDGDWKEVVHTHWNRDVIHVHQFPAITTAKLRYMPVGDLANKLWLSEIEVYGPASRR
ncbi:MAG: hypothetical protein ISS72_08805, partial [Candidatus Brocadiae bacterium]|nr:hypothetical protein [Candidatus Brocadiia bacterium]